MSSKKGINNQIFAIAWPAVVANITTPILGLVDTAIAGHLGSSTYLAAIALGSTVFNLLYWLFGFLRMGTAGLTSQAYGKSDVKDQSVILYRSVLLAILIGATLILLSQFFSNQLISLFDADDDVQIFAVRYFKILIWGAPATLIIYSLNGWLIGMQNTRLPMLISILTNITNICASCLFVFAFKFKIEGIAWGSLIATWIAVIVCGMAVFRKYRLFRIPIAMLYRGHDFKRLIRINLDIFLRTLCMVCVTAWFTRSGASEGVNVLAANSILMQFFLMFSYFSDGFAYAGEALAGKFWGSKNLTALKDVIKRLLWYGLALATLFALIYFFLGELIIGLLTNEKMVTEVAKEYLPWAVSIPICGIGAFIFDGVYIGLTRTHQMLYSVALGLLVYFAVYFLMYPVLKNHALWLAFSLYLLMRGITLWYFKHKE